ncbi:MAG TPA: hypothetical protein VK615_17655 [Candidatus Binatia bacterium]|nr:hypothetical protein [Candidatus Binatia bacterium]
MNLIQEEASQFEKLKTKVGETRATEIRGEARTLHPLNLQKQKDYMAGSFDKVNRENDLTPKTRKRTIPAAIRPAARVQDPFDDQFGAAPINQSKSTDAKTSGRTTKWTGALGSYFNP